MSFVDIFDSEVGPAVWTLLLIEARDAVETELVRARDNDCFLAVVIVGM